MSLNLGWPKKIGKMKATHINREIFVKLTGDIPADVVTLLGFFAIISTGLLMFPLHVSNERHPCLRYVGDDTTQLYRDYTKPLTRIPNIKRPGYNGKCLAGVFFRGSCGYLPPISFEGVDGRVGKFVWHSGCRGRRRDGMAMKKVRGPLTGRIQ